MLKSLLVAVILVIPAAASIAAHDFWLAARRTPDGVTVTGHVGEKFPVADSRTTPDPVDIWRVIGPSGDLAADGDFFQEGESLATRVALASPGTYLGVMTILAREIEMTGKEFTDYLREEGLDAVIAERARLGQSDAPAQERYARYAKIVMHTGGRDAAHVTRAAGIAAEFVPSANPATLPPGAALSVQMLVGGRPVVGAQVTAVSSAARLDGRTGADGRVTFNIPSRGSWLIKTVHMERPTTAGSKADWESYWVTLAFEN